MSQLCIINKNAPPYLQGIEIEVHALVVAGETFEDRYGNVWEFFHSTANSASYYHTDAYYPCTNARGQTTELRAINTKFVTPIYPKKSLELNRATTIKPNPEKELDLEPV